LVALDQRSEERRHASTGKVLRQVTMSLDGVVAGPDDAMDWVFSYERPTPAGEEVIETTSAIPAGGEGSPACRCWWHWTEQALPPAVGASHQQCLRGRDRDAKEAILPGRRWRDAL
jgi:hypothetical protein